jgi:hypothetical protein
VLAAVALVVRALVLACRGRYAAFLAEAGESAGTLSTWPVGRTAESRRAVTGCAVAADGAGWDVTGAVSAWGVAASAPATARAGAARPARRAAFCTGDGRLCRPGLLVLLVLLRGVPDLTNLP